MKRILCASLCVPLLLLSACGTLEITFDRTPTPHVPATGTVSALQTQNAQLSTQLALLNDQTGTPVPTPLEEPARTQTPPTASVPEATRITFLDGATVGVVNAPIQEGKTQSYVLQALESQPMFVYVGSLNNDVTVSIETQDGITILSAAAARNSWQGSLPKTEDYFLTIHGGATTENFSLTVTLPSRIEFPTGATAASVDGQTVAGYGVSYTVYAAKGQKMNVDLENRSGRASLSIYGFTDGQYYVRSAGNRTSVHLALPSTQDYIIVVVPVNDTVVKYSLTVNIQ